MSDGDGEHANEGARGWVEALLSMKGIGGWSADQRRALREHGRRLRTVFVERRSPRLAFVGAPDAGPLELLAPALDAAPTSEAVERKQHLGRGRWYEYDIGGEAIPVLDVRRGGNDEVSLKALDRQVPDVAVLVWPEAESQRERALDDLQQLVRAVRVSGRMAPPTITLFEDGGSERAHREIETEVRDRIEETALPDEACSLIGRSDGPAFADELVRAVPRRARVAAARAVVHPGPKRRVADELIRTSVGLAGTFAAAPLPVADIVPITGVQVSMIASIAHLSGREFAWRTVGEFAVAAGLNVGAGVVFRGLARTVVGMIPVAGAAVSTGMATTATAGLGRAAAAYFFEDTDSIPDVLDSAESDPGPLESGSNAPSSGA